MIDANIFVGIVIFRGAFTFVRFQACSHSVLCACVFFCIIVLA